VVADQRSPRDGRTIETIGQYNPQTDPSLINIDSGPCPALAGEGRAATRTVANLLRTQGIPGDRPLAGCVGRPVRNLLEFLARSLVESPDAVEVTESRGR